MKVPAEKIKEFLLTRVEPAYKDLLCGEPVAILSKSGTKPTILELPTKTHLVPSLLGSDTVERHADRVNVAQFGKIKRIDRNRTSCKIHYCGYDFIIIFTIVEI